MILELLLIGALAASPALAQEEAEPPAPAGDGAEGAEDGDPLAPYRAPFEVLSERYIGSASQPVEYNWRRSKVQLAATGSHPFELNNFNSLRAGGMVRVPQNRVLMEGTLSYVWVWDSPSSERLALTPYRQPSRPKRLELDVLAAFPVAEGVVTTYPRLFPAVQLTFNAYGGLRYLIYPTGFDRDMKAREIVGALVSPTITEEELSNLEETRLDAMQVDSARYGVFVGVGNDIYFRQGLFVSPRVLFALPVLAPVTETDMYFQADLSLVIGVAL